ncbi:serine hydrolase [Aquimarina sp. 2-A2]|uniref:serine hydrolase n=1 Tax=Aquimarina sp. 2-A2 TaxID=3382644 RepID=UPI00387F1BA9
MRQCIKDSVTVLMITVYAISYSLYGQQTTSGRAANLEDIKMQMSKKMAERNLPGLSVAVFENYEVIWTHQWGIKATDAPDKIDTNTAFSTASTTKAVVAMLCGILEEKGIINLDDPIENYLKRYTLQKSKYTVDVAVTWKHLLSHTGGTTHSGFADFYEGDQIPTPLQSLKGELLPRYDKEIDFMFTPGTDWAYSGGGYVLLQVALEDHLDQPIADLVQQYIFTPLGLQHTTLKQPNELGFLTNVAKVHDNKGNVIKTGLPITPQVAPSGMWSTPSDLAKIAIEMQNALRDNNNKLISNSVAQRITEIVSLHTVGGWSAGWNRSFGFGNNSWFSHGGSNTGVGGEFMATMKGGNGLAILANGEKPNRIPVMNALRLEIMNLLEWNHILQDPKVNVPKELSEAIIGSYADFLYESEGLNRIIEEDGQLYMASPVFEFMLEREKSKMIYMGDYTFKIDEYPNKIKFLLNTESQLTGLLIYRDTLDSKAVRFSLDQIRNNTSKITEAFLYQEMEEAKKTYHQIKKEDPTLNIEGLLNGFGYLFYMENKLEKATEVLKFNCEEHPDSWNTYDSLAEIYEARGNLKLAGKHYTKAMSLNPSSDYKKRVKQKIAGYKE